MKPSVLLCSSMAERESVLDAIFEEDDDACEALDDDDVEMLDVETLEPGGAPSACGGGDGGAQAAGAGPGGKNQGRRAGKKKNKKRRKSDAGPNIMDINRFVIYTCRNLKEKKSYLVWNAVGCLGVSAVSELVKEVEAIQNCGGQKTADGKRFRNGGGILWNILKTREPKIYKEIMSKGREFEKQFRQPNRVRTTKGMEENNPKSSTNAPDEAAGEVFDTSEPIPKTEERLELPKSNEKRTSVLERIRVPVAYDDLFEEGEIKD